MAPRKQNTARTNTEHMGSLIGNRSVRAAAGSVSLSVFQTAASGGPSNLNTIAEIARDNSTSMRRITHPDDWSVLESVTTSVAAAWDVPKALKLDEPPWYAHEAFAHAHLVDAEKFLGFSTGHIRLIPESVSDFRGSLATANRVFDLGDRQSRLLFIKRSDDVKKSSDMGRALVELGERMPTVSFDQQGAEAENQSAHSLTALGQQMLEQTETSEALIEFLAAYDLVLLSAMLETLWKLRLDAQVSPYDTESKEIWCEVFCPYFVFAPSHILEAEVSYVRSTIANETELWREWIEAAKSDSSPRIQEMKLDRIKSLIYRYADMSLPENAFLKEEETWS